VLRLAYISFDLNEHPVGRTLMHMLTLHSRRRVFVTAYHHGPLTARDADVLVPSCGGGAADDVSKRDDVIPALSPSRRSRLCDASSSISATVAIACAVRDLFAVRQCSDDVIAGHVSGPAAVDVLVDVTGATRGGRLHVLRRRPAAVIVSFAGYAGTLGAASVDYLVADAVVTPVDGFVHDATGGGAGAVAQFCGERVSHARARHCDRGAGSTASSRRMPLVESLLLLPVSHHVNSFEAAAVVNSIKQPSPRLSDAARLEGCRCGAIGFNGDESESVSNGRGVVLAALHALHKVSPLQLSVWMSIMRRVPFATLWLRAVRTLASSTIVVMSWGIASGVLLPLLLILWLSVTFCPAYCVCVCVCVCVCLCVCACDAVCVSLLHRQHSVGCSMPSRRTVSRRGECVCAARHLETSTIAACHVQHSSWTHTRTTATRRSPMPCWQGCPC
jgi:hypothetical protein